MQRETRTRKYADELQRTIRERDRLIEQLHRDVQRSLDEVHDFKVRASSVQDAADAMAIKLEKMGEQVGAANLRELATREVAATALHGMAALASAVQCGVSTTQIAVTLRSLERDGREQLKKASNGGHA